jgi:hypothetical protein
MSAIALRVLVCAAALSALALPPAAAQGKRGYSETGPLIMSGTMAPPRMSRRVRAHETCKPVTRKVQPKFSTLLKSSN